MENSAVDWFNNSIFELQLQIERKEISLGEFAVKRVEICEQAKEMEEKQRQNDFIGGYLTHAMKKNKLPYGIQYLNKVADIEKQAEKLYKKTV